MGSKKITVVVLIAVIGTLGVFWYINQQNIRERVLTSLKEDLNFCEIVEDRISFTEGEFWLICNGRPFYATYEEGKVNYTLNGWGFLKHEPEVWNDLAECDFYKSKKTDKGYILTFYCPANLSTPLTSKIYSFNLESLEMSKIEESEFSEVIETDVKDVYNFLKDCELAKVNSSLKKDPTLLLWFDCEGDNYLVSILLKGIIINPPILMDELSHEERARISFEKVFPCQITNSSLIIPRLGAVRTNSVCDDRSVNTTYVFEEEDLPFIMFQIGVRDVQNDVLTILESIGKFFIVPKFFPIENIKYFNVSMEPVLAHRYVIYDGEWAKVFAIITEGGIERVFRVSEGWYTWTK